MQPGLFKKFFKRLANTLSVFVMLMLLVIAFFAPKIAPYTPNAYNLDRRLEAPSAEHLLGTDEAGRDVLSRLIHGARVSLQVGVFSVAIYVLIGIVIGALAGYFGGILDLVFSRINEIMVCFPTLFLLLVLMAFLPPSLYNIVLVLGLTGWSGIARLMRAEVLKLRGSDYVLAAKLQGAGHLRVLFRHLLPNAIGPLLVPATFGISTAILIEASLSFLGFGVPPPTPSWGRMLSESGEVFEIAWWLTFFPGFMIFLTIMASNGIGQGLQRLLDPKESG